MEIMQIIRRIVREILFRDIPRDIKDDSDLCEYGLDSLSSIQLLVCVEEIFSITVPPARLRTEEVQSIARIAQLVKELREG